MRITFVLGHELPFPPEKGGGVNSLLAGLTVALAQQGAAVTAYSPSKGQTPEEDVLDGVRHVRVVGAGRAPGNLRNVAAGFPYALRVRHRLAECDVLASHMWHGFLFTGTRRAKVLTHTIHRDPKGVHRLFTGFDRVYTGSDSITEQARVRVPALSTRLRTIYNAVNFAGYSNPVRREPDGRVRFLFVGRFSADKGLRSLVRGFCRAAGTDRRMHLTTLGPKTREGGGDPDLLAELTSYVESQGCSQQVEFADPVFTRAELDWQIIRSDVVVLPSTGGETLNMSVLESMRIGRALLISDLPANRPLVDIGLTGFQARAGDEQDWQAKMVDLASDSDRLIAFGNAAFTTGRRKFSTEGIAREYLADFEALLRGKR